jgi:uncharacterized protein
MQSELDPTAQEDRIGLLDAMRGIAVLGILLMNITGFGLPHAYDDPTVWGGASSADLAVWRTMALFFEGTMRGLFTLLFGAGALLFLLRHASRSSGLKPADLYFRRTLWLVVFGLVNGYVLLWSGDILFYYGVIGLLLFVFRNMSAKRLIVLAAVVMILQNLVTVSEWVGYHSTREQAQAAEVKKAAGAALTPEEEQQIEAFADVSENFKPAREDLERMVERVSDSYTSAFRVISRITWSMETEFFFRHGLLECLGMMLLGMALFKLGILTGKAPTHIYLAMIVAGYGIGLSMNLYEVTMLERAGFATDALITSYLTYDVGRIPTTLGHVGVIALLCRAPALQAVTRTLAAVGQMALSNYLAQSVICMFIFTGAGLALFGQLQRHELYYVVVAIWIVELIWSPIWLRHFRFGPVEWLWRSLTYGYIQPMRRASLVSPQVPASQ